MATELITTPFKLAPEFSVEYGLTLSEILQKAQVPVSIWDNITLTVNAMDVRREQWLTMVPDEKDVITVYVVPMGGGGNKAILRTVALIAVAFAAPYAGAAVAGGLGVTSTAGVAAFTAGITVVGTLAINALIPPPKPAVPTESAVSNSYFLTGQQNRARLYETIPIVYGIHQMVANLATPPDVVNSGTMSFFKACYDFGLGGVTLGDLKAGDTSFETFNGQMVIHKRVPEHTDPTNPKLGLAPVDLKLVDFPIKYADLSLALDLLGQVHMATTAPDTSTALVEISFPRGLVKYRDDGTKTWLDALFKIEYRPTGGTTWIPLPFASTAYYGGAYTVSLPKEEVAGITPPPDDDDGPVRLEGTVSSDAPTYATTAPVLTLDLHAPGYYEPPLHDTVKFFNPSTNALYPDTQIGVNKTPTRLTGTDAEGVKVVTVGRKYQFEIIVVPGFVGYVTPLIYKDKLKDDPGADGKYYSGGVIKGEPFWIDTTAAAAPPEPPAPPPGTVPTDRYDDTPGNETWIYWVEKRPIDSSPLDWEYGGSVQLMIKGVSQPVAAADRLTYSAELMKTEVTANVAGSRWRKVWYALATAVKTMQVTATPYYEPDIPGGGGPSPPAGAPSDGVITVSGVNSQPGIVTIVMPFAAAGQYDIQVSRMSEQTTSNQEVDNASWVKLNSRGSTLENNPRTLLNLKKQHTLVEVYFRASENISGNIQQMSAFVAGEVRPRLRRGDGSTYWGDPIVTRNPIWAVLDILTGYSIQNHQDVPLNKDFKGGWVKDDQIDFDSFIDLAAYCRQSIPFTNHDGTTHLRLRHAIDILMASEAPIIETVQSILSQCRAQLIIDQQGRFSVMRDEVRTTPRQLFGPKNSWDFKGSRTFQEIPHAFHVQFISPELGYQTGVQTVYRPGYDVQNATIFEDLPTFGITEWHAASEYGVYMMAQALVRSEVFTMSCDAESLVVQRGDLVHIQHDVPLLGATSCIVKSVNGNRVTVDQQLNYPLGPFGYTWRQSDSTISTGDVTTVGADWFDVAGTPAIQPGDLIVIGKKKSSGLVTDPYIITAINPKADLTAELTMVRYDERVYDPNYANFPTWNPSFGESAAEGVTFGISNLDGFAGLDHVDRQPVCLSVLTWSILPVNQIDSVAAIRVEYRKDGQSLSTQLIQLEGHPRSWVHEYSATDTNFGAGTYTLTAISNLGYESQPRSVRVGQIRDRTPPARPQNFSYTYQVDGTTKLTWKKGTEKDLWNYVIKDGSTVIATPSWDKDSFTVQSLAETTYTLTAVDSSGNKSAAASVSATHTTPATPDNFQVSITGSTLTLNWDLLKDPLVSRYNIYYNQNMGATSPAATGTRLIGTTDKLTDVFTTGAKGGAYFLTAQNIFGNNSPAAKQATTDNGLAVTNVKLSQALEFIDRYPFSQVRLTWHLVGDGTNLDRFRVWFTPTGSAVDELIYEGGSYEATALWDAVRDKAHHSGQFTIQPIGINGTVGLPSLVPFTIMKDTTAPDAPEKFFANVRRDTVELNWLASRSTDVESYELRYTPVLTSPDWNHSTRLDLVSHQTSNTVVNARTGTYLIQAIDTSGNHSATAQQRTSIAELPDINVIQVIQPENHNWPGGLNGLKKEGAKLVTNGPWTPADPTTGLKGYREAIYTYSELANFGIVYEALLQSKIQGYARLAGSMMSSWPTLAGIDPIAGTTTQDYDMWLEYRTSDTAPVMADWPSLADPSVDPIAAAGSADWSPWRRFYAVSVTALTIQFRLVVRVYHETAEVVITSGRVEVDMEDRMWSADDVPINKSDGKTGTRINFTPAFREVEAVSVTIDGNTAFANAVVINKDRTGVNIYLEDANDPAKPLLDGQVDVIALGYGKTGTTSI